MGSREALEFVGLVGAMKVLKCTRPVFQRYLTNGAVCPIRRTGRQMFRVSDLKGLLDARQRGEFTLHEVAAIALQARSVALANEQRLQELQAALGIPTATLDRSLDGILSLLRDTQEPPSRENTASTEYVYFWSGSLVAMDEDYLRLVSQVTGNDEPWSVFLNFSAELRQRAGVAEDLSMPLRQAYAALDAARRHLRHVAYFYCRAAHSPRVADTIFVDKPGAVDTLLAILNTH